MALQNVILSSNPCPICIGAGGQSPMTLAEWRASSFGDTDSKKRYCNLKAHSCHCILVPTGLLDELPAIGEKVKLRGDEGTDIKPIVDIHPNEVILKELMEEYNATIGVLPREIYTMPIDDVIPFLREKLG